MPMCCRRVRSFVQAPLSTCVGVRTSAKPSWASELPLRPIQRSVLEAPTTHPVRGLPRETSYCRGPEPSRIGPPPPLRVSHIHRLGPHPAGAWFEGKSRSHWGSGLRRGRAQSPTCPHRAGGVVAGKVEIPWRPTRRTLEPDRPISPRPNGTLARNARSRAQRRPGFDGDARASFHRGHRVGRSTGRRGVVREGAEL